MEEPSRADEKWNQKRKMHSDGPRKKHRTDSSASSSEDESQPYAAPSYGGRGPSPPSGGGPPPPPPPPSAQPPHLPFGGYAVTSPRAAAGLDRRDAPGYYREYYAPDAPREYYTYTDASPRYQQYDPPTEDRLLYYPYSVPPPPASPNGQRQQQQWQQQQEQMWRWTQQEQQRRLRQQQQQYAQPPRNPLPRPAIVPPPPMMMPRGMGDGTPRGHMGDGTPTSVVVDSLHILETAAKKNRQGPKKVCPGCGNRLATAARSCGCGRLFGARERERIALCWSQKLGNEHNGGREGPTVSPTGYTQWLPPPAAAAVQAALAKKTPAVKPRAPAAAGLTLQISSSPASPASPTSGEQQLLNLISRSLKVGHFSTAVKAHCEEASLENWEEVRDHLIRAAVQNLETSKCLLPPAPPSKSPSLK